MLYTKNMNTTQTCLSGCLAATLLFSAALHAATVYRSVDENGTVTFSDSPPEDGSAAQTLEIEAPKPQPDEAQQQRLEDMRATTDKMVADRMAREKHRAEVRKLQREAELAAQPPSAPAVAETPYYGGVWGGSYYPPIYRPHPPLARPPLRPARPQPYPASRIRRHYDPKVREVFTR